MTETLKQIIKREVDKLSKDGQEAVNSLDWAKITEEIGKKYLLNEDEINVLQAETLTVLIGLADFDFYVKGVEDEVGVSKEEAKKIADEVMQKIFTPIGNIIIDNIKKSGKHKNANAQQTLDFILSGGDYSAFATPVSNSPLEEYSALKAEGGGSIPPSPSGRVREGLSTPSRERATPQEGNTPKKMDDIKSKFTI